MGLEAFRVVTLLLGGVAFGLTCIVVSLYWRARGVSSVVPPYHVPVIGFAHICLIVAISGQILEHVATGHPFSWWLTPVGAVGMTATVIALVGFLRSERAHQVKGAPDAQAR